MYIIIISILLIFIGLFIYDRFIQKENLVNSIYPIIWRTRNIAFKARPFIRQYFFNNDEFVNNVVINWILRVSNWNKWDFSFDKFDTKWDFHNWEYSMIHSTTPLNYDEMKITYPLLWKKRKISLQLNSYIYKSAMSLWAINFEATLSMAKACVKEKVAFNTWEWWLWIQHIPEIKFSKDKKYFKYIEIWKIYKYIILLIPWNRLKNRFIEFLGNRFIEDGKQDLYLFCKENFLFYAIDWDAPLEYFPSKKEFNESFWQIIFQIGSWLFWVRKNNQNSKIEIDWDRFKKVMSFCSAVEIKLAQWAKQSGWILRAKKNNKSIAEIRWIKNWIDIISPNRFPFYQKWKEKEFFEFIEQLSEKSWWKPVWIKLVISNESNIEPIAKELSKQKNIWPDFITVDWWDWWSWAAPYSLWILFWKKINDALKITNNVLEKYEVRDKVKILASSKLYAPHMSAKALALWADAIWNARSIMISAWCIRAWLCSWEEWDCPVWIATMKKGARRSYLLLLEKKVNNIANYLKMHNKWIIEVAAIAWVESPHLLTYKHIE